MTTLRVTDLPEGQAKAETFLDGTVRVLSRSGLHVTEALLIESLPTLPSQPASLLVAGNRTGAVALIAAARIPGCAVTCHAFDLHHARAILRNLAANGAPSSFLHDPFVTAPPDFRPPPSDRQSASPSSLRVACTAKIPPAAYDAALFMATPGTMTGELILDQLEDLHNNLAAGGTCVIACEADSGPLFKQIKGIFGNLSVRFDKKGVVCATAVKREPLARPREFAALFAASLPGGEPLRLRSLPGVFCHRRPDTGGLALAEVAARDLTTGQRVLDFGCGCGLVGLLLARHRPDTRVTFADSHARALAATHFNLGALGLDGCALHLSDTGTRQTGFDLFAGNPPYYSDFRIAELFVDTAHAALRAGGAGFFVAKSSRELAARVEARFGRTEVVPRRGYCVVRARR
jgi:16S rRNA (guanine1207-N2)-methyltransferase